MDLKFQQSEPIATRRRWIIVLVQDADATAGLTGATGQVYISKNGAAGVLSTASLVEIDATNMPGQYYVELTAGELSDLGWISIYKKTASSKPFEDRGFVSYDDPAARHGGFAQNFGSGGKSGGLSKTQAKALLTDIRTIVQEELAKDEAEDDQEEMQEQKDYTEKLDAILAAVSDEPDELDLSPVLDAIAQIKPAKDYSKDLAKMAAQINAFGNTHNIDVAGFTASVKTFQDNMAQAANNVTTTVGGLQSLQEGFTKLQELMEAYGASLTAQIDMDVRFAKLEAKAKDETLQRISDQLQKLIKAMEFVLKNMK